jgi:hypothetical protein
MQLSDGISMMRYFRTPAHSTLFATLQILLRHFFSLLPSRRIGTLSDTPSSVSVPETTRAPLLF